MPIAETSARDTGPVALALVARVALVLVVTAVAYQYTLGMLWRGFGELAPIAYGVLIAPLALLVAMVHGLERVFEPDIHDRSLDYMIGGTLLAAALVIVLILPLPLSVFFWHWRIDVLSVPIFLAATICIAFDVRAVWRMRYAIALLLLAWPPPYFILAPAATSAVGRVSGPLVHAVWPLLSGRHLVSDADLGVVAAGPQIPALLAFLVVTVTIVFLTRGSTPAKVGWLATGLVVAWALDLAQMILVSLLTAGLEPHPSVWLSNPYAGLISFGVALALMVAAAPLYGLGPRTTHGVRRIDARRSGARLGLATAMVCVAAVLVAAAASRPLWQSGSYVGTICLCLALLLMIAVALIYGFGPKTLNGVRRVAAGHSASRLGLVAILIGGAGMLIGVGDAQLRQYEPVADALGATRIPADSVASFALPGWTVQTESHRWAAISLDKSATWTRYTYQPSAPGDGASTGAMSTLTIDVISTTDLALFSTFGIQASYRLQNHPLLAADWVDLGDGVSGHIVRYALDGSGATWTGVYWQWPVRTAAGQRYERLVLSARETLGARGPALITDVGLVRRTQLDIANSTTSLEGQADDWKAPPQRDFMVGMARKVVAAAVAQAQYTFRSTSQ